MSTWEVVVFLAAISVATLVVLVLVIAWLVSLRNKRATATRGGAGTAAGAPAPAAAPAAPARPAPAAAAPVAKPHWGWAVGILTIMVVAIIWAKMNGADWKAILAIGKMIGGMPLIVLIVAAGFAALIVIFGGKKLGILFKVYTVALLGVLLLAAVAVNGLPWSDDDNNAGVDGPQVKWLTPPSVDWPEETWPKLNQPGNSKSEFLPLPSGMKRIVIMGDGHRVENEVRKGKTVGFYVYNDASTFRTFAYAFAK